ncbi:MAG: metallophosphoesterase family protein [Cyanobacteria bacterium P01_A01_bin.84]
MISPPKLLTDPFLQLPTQDSVRVVWFTEFAGKEHIVNYGKDLNHQTFARTTKLNRVREDQKSRVGKQIEDAQIYKKPSIRNIWRHEAQITNLIPNQKVNYSVTSIQEDGQTVTSSVFTLSPAPKPGTPLKILLTSDHQIKPMVAANLQKVVETVGKVDAVWFAGDLVNIPDRGSEWFDDNRGNAFFPCLQGRGNYKMEHNNQKTIYTGGEIIQHAPMFTCIGNHEIMGRYGRKNSISEEFNDTIPREIALQLYGNGSSDLENKTLENKTLKNNSFNTDTYEEIFTLPESQTGGKTYYAVSFGDIRLIVLYITNMWRFPNTEGVKKGKYEEPIADLNQPENWGYGQHIYEPISKGSAQYNWLVEELESPEFRQAKYKIVMFHHPPHTLGDNIVPPYTNPTQIIQRDEEGNIQKVSYKYPKDDDYIIRDIIPLLEYYQVQLVFYGHSHLWNRFISPSGMHFLETSNVGNSYGAAYGNKSRKNLPSRESEDLSVKCLHYVKTGDPYGLEPVEPTIKPFLDENKQPLPYVSSNDITVFSIFETATATIRSYYFDTRKSESSAVKFDEFRLMGHEN